MKINILATSDMHGFVLPTSFTEREMNLPFGVAKVQTKLKELEAAAEGHVLKVENGDLLQGSALTYYLAKQSKTGVQALTQVMNKIGYDAGVLGNHEFNYGRAYLDTYVEVLDYPILVSNVFAQGEPAFGEGYKIFEFEGVKIALVGFMTQYVPHWEKPATIEGLSFAPIMAVADPLLYYLRKREKVDIIIVAYHGGFEKDLKTGVESEAQTGENEAYQLLEKYSSEIDALITGHQHRELAEKVFGVPVIQPGFRGAFVGEIVLELNEKKKVIASSVQLHETGDSVPDQEILDLIGSTSQEVEDWLDMEVGKISGDMTISNPMEARYKEHSYIELINKIQMEASHTKISGTSLFNNEAKGFDEIVTMRDILTNYIYPNTLAVLRVSGAELRQALELSAAHLELDEDKIIFSPRFSTPKAEYYNYDMYEGIDYSIDLKERVGSRITRFEFEGHSVEDNEVLEIVVNQYRAVGGGNYDMFSADKIVREITVDMTELIVEYFTKHPLVKAETNNNFNIVK